MTKRNAKQTKETRESNALLIMFNEGADYLLNFIDFFNNHIQIKSVVSLLKIKQKYGSVASRLDELLTYICISITFGFYFGIFFSGVFIKW